MTTTTHPQAPGGAPARTGPTEITRVQQHAIEGRYRPITTHQLTLAWWLYSSKTITKRQLRLYFASHELAERRFYTASEREGCADFTLSEIKALVGGRGSPTADRDLSADIKRLGALGLVQITRRSITFAESIEQVAVEDTAGFFRMWAQMDERTRGRSVPVPRRMLRELAAGFTTGATAYLIASFIRCVFWRRSERRYNTDGRVRDGWVAETFGLGLTAVRQGRRRLQALGLLERRTDTPQWLLNRHGNHLVVNCDWSRPEPEEQAQPDAVENSGTTPVGEGESAAKSDTPPAQNSARSDTPCLNRSALPTGDSKTRRLGGEAPDPAGVSSKAEQGSRNKNTGSAGRKARPASAPNIRDIQPCDFDDTGRLLELHRQAIEIDEWGRGEGSELDFLAMAERARTRGREPARLLRDLIRNRRFAFITNADEDRARERLAQHRREEAEREGSNRPEAAGAIRDVLASLRVGPVKQEAPRLSPEGAFVEACVRAARAARLREEQWWFAAKAQRGWTRDQWDDAYLRYQLEQTRQWHGAELEGALA